MAKNISDQEFADLVADNNNIILVDFWAPWCKPCTMLAPMVEKLSEEFEGKMHVVKMNIDDNQEVASNFGVRSIPTLMIFKEGKSVGSKVGVHEFEVLRDWAKNYI